MTVYAKLMDCLAFLSCNGSAILHILLEPPLPYRCPQPQALERLSKRVCEEFRLCLTLSSINLRTSLLPMLPKTAVDQSFYELRVHMNVVRRSTGTQIVEQRINSEV